MKLFFIILFSTSCFAEVSSKVNEVSQKVPMKPGYETLNMDEFKNIDSTLNGANTKFNFKVGCRWKSGLEVKSTDVGYDSCMRELEADRMRGQRDNTSASSSELVIGN